MNQHLQQFAQQLAVWTEAIIEYGRTPFRRVDTYPDIDTEQGVMQPPLVFWINRQSMMAGGVLLLPENNLEDELKRGRNCAVALGLCHFVTWETDQVRIWRLENEKTVEQQSFPLTNPNHPETFRYLLADVLDALKLLAVLGAIPATDLSPWYLNNLYQITLQQALPSLIDAYRSQRSEIDDHSAEDADTCANEANRLLLLQVLSLLWFKKFPDAVLPEKMERAIELSLPELPDSLLQPLSLKTTIRPPTLPLETAVYFYHLLLRLRQLSWDQPIDRAKASLQRLTEYWYQNKTEEDKTAAVLLYPETPPSGSTAEILLSRSPSFLAATALLATITTDEQCKSIFGNLFQLDRSSLPNQKVWGILLDHKGIATSERREYTARLRSAWPNRHLKIKTGQPFWLWELIHLLGICHEGQHLTLELPLDLLRTQEAQPAWLLLYENFSFLQIQRLNNDNLQLNILRGKQPKETFPLHLADEVRKITPLGDPDSFKNQLLLALTLPADIYQLLGTELIWPDHAGVVPDAHFPGWKLYRKSGLYQWLWNILQNETIQPLSREETTTEAIRTYVPYPEPLLLNELTNFGRINSTAVQVATIDQFLANLLACPTVENIEPENSVKASKPATTGIHSGKKIKEALIQQLSAHGIPNFPEQYLYFLDYPEMCHYTITPPLQVKNNLLGQFELEDAKGQIIAGYGEELEQTLLICSKAEKTVIDLPSDRYQLEKLLQYYQKDLRILYKHLQNLCYSQVESSKSARKLIKNIWEQLNLPAPSWFNN
ncbi:MAG: hypothetical protein U9R69_03505 [Thermodesulfobacteriota bacterium]|nr:hypothetical protein [Thermodesulfobacteriota bacterium]